MSDSNRIYSLYSEAFGPNFQTLGWDIFFRYELFYNGVYKAPKRNE